MSEIEENKLKLKLSVIISATNTSGNEKQDLLMDLISKQLEEANTKIKELEKKDNSIRLKSETIMNFREKLKDKNEEVKRLSKIVNSNYTQSELNKKTMLYDQMNDLNAIISRTNTKLSKRVKSLEESKAKLFDEEDMRSAHNGGGETYLFDDWLKDYCS